MLFRSLVAASVLLAASPALAQEAPVQSGDHADLGAAAGRFVVPTNAERTRVVVDLLTEAGLKAEIQTFQGGNDRTGPMEGANVVTTVGEGPADIVLTAHYDAVKLRDGALSQGVVDNAGSVLALIQAAAPGNRDRIQISIRMSSIVLSSSSCLMAGCSEPSGETCARIAAGPPMLPR